MRDAGARLAALALAAAAPLAARDAPRAEPITIGTSHSVTTHGAERRINVVLPPDYAADERRYPLLLVLDGGLGQDFFLTLGIERWNGLWQRSQPVIFVAVETVDRQRELLPPTADADERRRYPTVGESAAFRRWLERDILPMLRSRYRTDGRAFLVGESAAGHFVVETWARQPALFDGYAALSPSLHWDGQALSRQVPAAPSRPPLFLSLADEGGATERGVMRLLAGARPNLCFADGRATLTHATALHGLLPAALQYLLPTDADWLDGVGMALRCAGHANARPGND